MNTLDVIAFLFQFNNTTQEFLPVNDYAGFFALLLLGGGLFFWVMVIVCAMLALFNCVRRLYAGARAVMPAMKHETAE